MTVDLQELFDREGTRPPVSTLDPAVILQRGRLLRRRRRMVIGVAATGGLGAVAVGTVAFLGTSPAAGPAPLAGAAGHPTTAAGVDAGSTLTAEPGASSSAAETTVRVGSKIPIPGTRGVIRVTADGACLDASADDGPQACINVTNGNFDLDQSIVGHQGAGWDGISVVYGAVRSDVASVTVRSSDDGGEVRAHIYDPANADWKLYLATGTFKPRAVRKGTAPTQGYSVVARDADGDVLRDIYTYFGAPSSNPTRSS